MGDFRIAVLASGSGSLFQALIDQQPNHGGQLIGLITDVVCPAIERAKLANIPTELVPLNEDRAQWDKNLCSALIALNPNLIVSAGFMKIIGPKVLEKFQGKIINTHPALLPKYPGAHAVADVLAAGETFTGSTIHFVDEGVDTGKIIAQEKVQIVATDNESTLHEKIKVVERELLVQVVASFVSGQLKVLTGK